MSAREGIPMPEMSFGRRRALSTVAAAALLPRVAGGAERLRILRLADAQIGQADPHKAVDFPAAILMFNLYDFLVRPLPKGELAPSLAESWTISLPGTEYTFRIRDGVTFHDASPLSANDVVFSA